MGGRAIALQALHQRTAGAGALPPDLRAVEAKLPQYFSLLPKAKLDIQLEPELTRATASDHYTPVAADGSHPGVFWAVVNDPKDYDTVGMATLLLHEGVPGHHFHAALLKELPLPDFRKFFTEHPSAAAYTEGWALYCETLGREFGFYDDPAYYYGHLNDELLRAVRLVVDTGMHAQGWSREQAVAYMMDNLGYSEARAANQIERYMVWPGQALAYKTGALKILELRARAQQALGPKFSYAKFHEVVLGDGTLPLPILEAQVNRPSPEASTWLSKLGPGLITGAADDDPSGIATYSQAGAQFGFNLLWTLLLTYPLMAAIQVISAQHRPGHRARPGHQPAALCAAPGRVGHRRAAAVANIINIAADVAAMGDAMSLVAPGRPQLVCGRLRRAVGAAAGVHPLPALREPAQMADARAAGLCRHRVRRPRAVGRGAATTVWPRIAWNKEYLTTIVAVFGTTISPYLFFWQASQEVEELRADDAAQPLRQAPEQVERQFSRIRFDTLVGMGVSNGSPSSSC
jgi:hypothetical protein